LKEKGFNERLLTFYITDETKKEGCFQIMAFTDDKIDNNHSDHCYLAPTLQMVMKWLREVHNIAINIGWGEILETKFQWWCIILNQKDGSILRESEYSPTYEQAVEAAIKHCLEHLI
jgi:hypothetical protein